MMSVKTILFVENDAVSQSLYQKRLEREGFHLECAQDGQVAIDILSDHVPDLVLLDLMLPRVSGADVLKFMHADPRLTTVPVIIFSNAAMTEVPPDSPLAQGTKRLLKSDCTFPKLLETIQETLAAVPELVVVEAGKASSTRRVPAHNGNGESKSAHSRSVPVTESEAKAAKESADFLEEALAVMPKIREHSMGYIKAPDSEASQAHLSGLHKRVHLLNTAAAQAGCARVALLTSAFDALLSGIVDKPATVTPSVLQTIAQAVDCLDGLLKNTDGYSLGPGFQAKVLVVDDDTVCNHVNVTSLKRANFDTVGAKDPAAALSLLETTQYDLVVLDVNMPGMTGFDVCEKLRRLPHCKKTPVIFVTAFSNFDNRKQSVLSGGNDFVSKPVSPVELALKVSVNLIKARVQGTPGSPLEAQPAAANGSSHSPPPAARTKTDRQVSPETPAPEPPSRLASPPKPNARNARTAATPPEIQPEPEPRPANAPGNDGKNSAEIHERLRQGTAALEHAKANLDQESAERTRIESQWREQLNTAKALIGQTEDVLKEKEAQCHQLEKELAGLQQLRDELQGKLATEQQAVAKSQQEIKAFQERQGQSAAELERAKTALKEKEVRCNQLEEESAGLRKLRDELQGKLATEQQAVAKSQQEIKAFQERQGQSAAELERARTALEQQSAERTRLESEWREQLNAAKTAVSQTGTTLKEKEVRCNQLEKELVGLQQTRDELQNKFATGQKTAEKLQQENKELQADLGQQTAERMRLESEWREQLKAAKVAVGQTETALKEKETRCGQLEKELTGLRQVREELQGKFAAEQQAVAKSQQEIKELQEHLRQGGADLERTKASLEQESAKRARLESDFKTVTDAREALNLELRSLRERQAAREAELRDRQKKFVEGLRENMHHLQAKLQEIETLGSNPGEASGGKT
ncbi:MAG TPA: response regulator [Candidatus Limnocylindrales bacterium]|nr:response regulator [Candidatus Limnocylindrales bacterium]